MKVINLDLDQLAQILTEATQTEIISSNYAGMMTTKIIHPTYGDSIVVQGIESGAVLITSA